MKRLLLVDDEEGIRTVWKRFHDVVEPVFRGQCDLDVAGSLEQGLARMKETEYDAVIFDLKLPPLDAEQVITFIVENANVLPVISVLTGDEDINIRRRCILAGAADFWLKHDANTRPDLFFKSLYNEYLKRQFREPTS